MTRLGINSVFNAGAIEWGKNIVLAARVEGWDRKSFFAVAESKNGVDRFKFWDYPVRIPELDSAETNLYDIRLVRHEDGWIYGLSVPNGTTIPGWAIFRRPSPAAVLPGPKILFNGIACRTLRHHRRTSAIVFCIPSLSTADTPFTLGR